MIKTITLTPGEVNSVEFAQRYPYFYIKNFSTSDVYASIKKFIFVADEDEVTKIPAGTTGIVYGTLASEYVNILCENSAKIEVIGAFENNINFSRKIALGGDSGTSGAVDAYSKTEINDMLSEKADNSDVENVSNTVNTHISDKSVHMTITEKEKLASLKNYDDTEIKANIAKKVDQKDGYSLVSDTEITRLAEVKNYDDTQVKNDIAELQSKTTDTAWTTVDLTTATTNLTFDSSVSNWINYRKIGSIVYVRASMKFTAVSDEDVVMENMTGILPNDFKPKSAGIMLGRCGAYTSNNNSDFQPIYWQLNPSGSVSISLINNQKLCTAINKSVSVQGMYFID